MQHFIHRFVSLSALLLLLTLLVSCNAPAGRPQIPDTADAAPPESTAVTFTDAAGNEVLIASCDRVVSLYGSFAEAWMLAGGTLAGITEDAIEERHLDFGDADVAMIGSVKEPSLEEILAVKPDFVMLSADIAPQVALDDALTRAGICHAYFRVDTFADYLSMLEIFCRCTGHPERYETYGTAVQEQIHHVLEAVDGQPSPTVLLLRAYATGIKAKGSDNLTGIMLQDLGADNLAERGSILEDISLEEILVNDPEFIFVTTMGKESAALAYLKENFESNPAWASLSAVQNDRVIILPKELFHYKPNARWGESYEMLAAYLYPQLAAEFQ